jgi:hypothetical protein
MTQKLKKHRLPKYLWLLYTLKKLIKSPRPFWSDPVLDVWIRPKRSGLGSATLPKGQLISVAEPHHFYESLAPGKNLCGSGSKPTVSVADLVRY